MQDREDPAGLPLAKARQSGRALGLASVVP